jgi:hypothetical protein
MVSWDPQANYTRPALLCVKLHGHHPHGGRAGPPGRGSGLTEPHDRGSTACGASEASTPGSLRGHYHPLRGGSLEFLGPDKLSGRRDESSTYKFWPFQPSPCGACPREDCAITLAIASACRRSWSWRAPIISSTTAQNTGPCNCTRGSRPAPAIAVSRLRSRLAVRTCR